MTRGEANDENRQAAGHDLPSQASLLPKGCDQWIETDFVGGRQLRLWIEQLVEEKVRSITETDRETPRGLPRHRVAKPARDQMTIRQSEPFEIKTVAQPDAAAGRSFARGLRSGHVTDSESNDEHAKLFSVPIQDLGQDYFSQRGRIVVLRECD